jgi:aspartyl/asparaginyl beta-hydroxylase (cupin superfamily)
VSAEPNHPRALNALGNRLLSTGAAAEARALFERAVVADPTANPIWLNLAAASRADGDAEAELKALDAALQNDPYSSLALLLKAQLLERTGHAEPAAATYAALLACVPADAELAPAMAAALDHARHVVGQYKARLGERIRSAVAGTGATSARFEHAVGLLTGTEQLYLPKPSGVHFPYLPAVPFFERDQFPWFAELEAGTDMMREELLGVMTGEAGVRPYVAIAPGLPVNQWDRLNHSRDWSAYFLWENGVPSTQNADRCPGTAALLARLPLLDIPSRGPTAMFSILKPGAIIPPHTGVTNIRAVVHLPLVVPSNCGFRVGAESREWREGVAWAFDDTIEHEAWNGSARPRAILIADAWNPYLCEDERILLRLATQALAGGLVN